MKYNFFTNLLQNSNGHLEIKLSNEVSINITDPSITEGDDGIKLMTFSISASRDLTGKESVTLNLNIEDLGTNSSDYGSLSDSSIQNGVTDEGELVSLAAEGITEISLNTVDGTTFEHIDENGNTISNQTGYKSSNGDGLVRDLWFNYENLEEEVA